MAELQHRVLLTDSIHPDGQAILAKGARLIVSPDPRPATLKALIGDVDGIIVRSKLPDDIFDHAPRLKGVVRHGVGLDVIPVEAATARGIVVANTPGINTNAVAEYAFAALLSLRRSIPAIDTRLRATGWDEARAFGTGLSEIGGTTLGIVGLGAIGQRIAAMAIHGFSMKVLAVSRSRQTMQGVEHVGLDEAFRRCDAVVLACSLTPETRGMVDGRLLCLMKPDAVLINVARGPVVVTSALVDALRSGALAGAALDVHEIQPLSGAEALFSLPNVILTPHLAGITATSSRAMSVMAAQEMLRIVTGQTPLHPVNLPFPGR